MPDPELCLREGAIEPWEQRNAAFYQQLLEALAGAVRLRPLRALGRAAREREAAAAARQRRDEVEFSFEKGGQRHSYRRPFEGVIANLERRLDE